MISENSWAKFIKLYQGGFAEYRYPKFKKYPRICIGWWGNCLHFGQQQWASCRRNVHFSTLVFNMNLAFEIKTFCVWKWDISKRSWFTICAKMQILKMGVPLFKWVSSLCVLLNILSISLLSRVMAHLAISRCNKKCHSHVMNAPKGIGLA